MVPLCIITMYLDVLVPRWNSFPKEPKLVSFLSSLMTVATMDEDEAAKVSTNDTVTAASRRGMCVVMCYECHVDCTEFDSSTFLY